jgi:hypothetical protein
MTLSEKQTKIKRTRGMTQVVDHLPSKHKAQNSIPKTIKKLILIGAFIHTSFLVIIQ